MAVNLKTEHRTLLHHMAAAIPDDTRLALLMVVLQDLYVAVGLAMTLGLTATQICAQLESLLTEE